MSSLSKKKATEIAGAITEVDLDAMTILDVASMPLTSTAPKELVHARRSAIWILVRTHGISRNTLSKLINLSPGRVKQIVNAVDEQIERTIHCRRLRPRG
jgi:hypothetical protein